MVSFPLRFVELGKQPGHSVEGLRQFLKRSNTRGCEWDHDSRRKRLYVRHIEGPD
jgi:hypothetical protein